MTHEMNRMIEDARRNGLWLYSSYQDIWMSPDDLAREQANGNFRWGAVNWQLRNPQERIQRLEEQVRNAQSALTAFRLKVSR